MKEAELRKHAKCNLCHRLIGESGMPLFWRVTIERFGLDLRAIEAQTGLAMMLGNAFLAGVMGPDRDVAKPVMSPSVVTVCETCCTRMTCVAELSEVGQKQCEACVTPTVCERDRTCTQGRT